ncbi:MAG TPA: hypothetical protein VFN30_04750 [Chitinophagaceae bacterium]|nr:hypothetical protein [Chitinophagaceae bacterium]
MKKVFLAFIVLSLIITSCNRSITIQQAANGGTKKCGKYLR